MKTTLLSAAVVAAAATAASPAFAGAVLDKIRANDQLVCGVNTSAPYSSLNADSILLISFSIILFIGWLVYYKVPVKGSRFTIERPNVTSSVYSSSSPIDMPRAIMVILTS
jgi:ABC-type amino acid transport substrate-binding protein